MTKSLLIAAALCVPPLQTLSAQEEAMPDSAPGRLLVFLDCNARNCDFDHVRREITWVNWVRDRQDSDLHILITGQRTGARGVRYTIDFIGRRELSGREKSLILATDPDATDSERRDALTQMIALGLVEYIETSALAPHLRILYEDVGPRAPLTEADDPWDLWVFRLGADFFIGGESKERAYELDGSASADRVGEDLKLQFFASADYEREEFDDLNGGETFVNTTVDFFSSALAVWSLSPHWSTGGRVRASKSTFRNQDLVISGGPAIEYNIYPWRESTRRALTVRYGVEVAYFDYELITVEDETAEWRPRHRLEVSAAVQQPWGEVFGSVEGIQYLDDPATHRIDTRVRLEYRLFRGLNLDLFASVDRIKDQFFLPAAVGSEEEILVRRRQRETSFRFDVGFGFSYRFGSRFANIVNPRLD